MQCASCGYNLEPWDTACPKCAMASQPGSHGTQPPPPSTSYAYPPVAASAYSPLQPSWYSVLHTFRPIRGIAIALLVALVIGMLADAASVFSDLAQASMLKAAANGSTISQTAAL